MVTRPKEIVPFHIERIPRAYTVALSAQLLSVPIGVVCQMAKALSSILDVAGVPVPVSNLEKIYYPQTGFTKGEMLAYYIAIAPVLLPHLQGRPLTMKRYPNGVEAPFFYEKQCPQPKPPFVETTQVARHHKPGEINFCLVNNLPTLVWAANLGDLELHTLLSRAPAVHQPTQIVFDLDPGAPADVVQCAQVALWLRELFTSLGLEIFVKSSGSKGLQIYLPLNRPSSYAETSPLAKAIAQTLERLHPELVVSDMKKALRQGKVLIDWSQNSETKTTISVYSLRAKEHPYVSMPLEWAEVARCLKQGEPKLLFFEAEQALKRVKKKGDLFAPVLTLQQDLGGALDRLGSYAEKSGAALRAKPSIANKSPIQPAPPAPRTRLKGRGDGTISAYNAKRDFAQTREPAGAARNKPSDKSLLFVIQKHDASHLHYDFRLELDGVLKSWAVPKGLPYDKQTKRLAMMVEDHPYDYARFEGTIPAGNYGAGTVMVWDIGTWENLGPEPHEGLRTGKLHFRLQGKKLKGEWALVQMHGAHAQKGNEWLMLKHGSDMKPLSARQDDRSALSAKTLTQLAAPGARQWTSRPAHADAPDENEKKPSSSSFRQRVAELAQRPASAEKPKTRAARKR